VIFLNLVLAGLRLGLKNRQAGEKWIFDDYSYLCVKFDISLNVWVFTALLFILGISWGFGKASVFKFLSDEYPDNIGVVSGVVGMAGLMIIHIYAKVSFY
jgi:nitrate/nitrite transporter NarK